MRHLVCGLLFWCLGGVVPSQATVLATDDFNRADANPLGAPWVTITDHSACTIVSQAVQPPTFGSDTGCYYSGVSWPADQYAQITLGTTVGGDGETGFAPVVRASASANTYYRCTGNDAADAWALAKLVNGTYTVIQGGSATISPGDTLRLEVQGTTVRCLRNGVQLNTVDTDTSIASGNAGLMYSTTVTSGSADNFEGGDFVSSGTAALTILRRLVP